MQHNHYYRKSMLAPSLFIGSIKEAPSHPSRHHTNESNGGNDPFLTHDRLKYANDNREAAQLILQHCL